MKKIAIVGNNFSINNLLIEQLKEKEKNIVIIDNSNKETIEVNGEIYEIIEKETESEYLKASKLAVLELFATNSMYSSYSRKLRSDIDIIKEYRLIQLKESELSRWERDRVVSIFESKFKKLKR